MKVETLHIGISGLWQRQSDISITSHHCSAVCDTWSPLCAAASKGFYTNTGCPPPQTDKPLSPFYCI